MCKLSRKSKEDLFSSLIMLNHFYPNTLSKRVHLLLDEYEDAKDDDWIGYIAEYYFNKIFKGDKVLDIIFPKIIHLQSSRKQNEEPLFHPIEMIQEFEGALWQAFIEHYQEPYRDFYNGNWLELEKYGGLF